jgi:hypothetical protein
LYAKDFSHFRDAVGFTDDCLRFAVAFVLLRELDQII